MTEIAKNDAQVRSLVDAAQRAFAAGQREDAARVLAEARAAAPEHPLVLNALGMQALDAGEAKEARGLIERAVAANSQTPQLWLSLALACRALGDGHAELAALAKALALDPYFFLALMQKAAALERQGAAKKAAAAYRSALCCIPRISPLPQTLQAAIARARAAVAADANALEHFLRDRVGAARAQHANARQDRFDDCLEILLGKKRVFVQQPTYMHFPRLPAIQFHDRADFPWLNAVEAATDDIRDELVRVLAEDSDGLVPYVTYPAGAPLNQWKELNNSRKWSAFYLMRDGERLEERLARCPKTAAVLGRAPLADLPGHAPTAFFSILGPRTRIPPHTGVTNTRLVVHLPLIVPGKCGFRVGSDTRVWIPGKAWVFDDSIEHEAWNESEDARAILIFDIWNPQLTAAERDLVRAATTGIADYYDGESPLAAQA
ncbi:MAG: aspartyl/asparaginyl beta-hydroxylase domain-containing protein [Steroidobacteraceae bacterium]